MKEYLGKTFKEGYPLLPKLLDGTVFILGGGPSLFQLEKDSEIMGLLNKVQTIAVNGALKLIPNPTVHFFADAVWYLREKERIDAYQGPKFTFDKRYVPKGAELNSSQWQSIAGSPGLTVLAHCSFGWVEKGNTVPFNRSSGAAAINLAHLLGAKKAVLVGFDMRSIDGSAEYYSGDSSIAGRTHGLDRWEEKYVHFLSGIQIMVDRMVGKTEFQVFNGTAGSRIPFFPFVDLKEALHNG